MMSRADQSELADARDSVGLGAFSGYPRRVGELMTADVLQLFPHNLFRDAVDLLAQNQFRHLMVAEPSGRLVGVISDRDILRAAESYESDTTLVADVMTPEPITVTAASPLSEAILVVLETRVSCLPVVDDAGRIRGIVTTTDLLTAFQALQHAVEKLPKSSTA